MLELMMVLFLCAGSFAVGQYDAKLAKDEQPILTASMLGCETDLECERVDDCIQRYHDIPKWMHECAAEALKL